MGLKLVSDDIVGQGSLTEIFYGILTSDDESQLVTGSPIVTITLCLEGVPRKFRIRNKSDKTITKDILTTNGIVLTMGGDFQKEFKHEIVKVTGGAAKKVGPRISLTFRQFV